MMNNMIYKSKEGDLDLSKVTRLYPAGVVDMYGEVAEMSVEWIEMNADKINLKHFVLVFDFAPLNADERDARGSIIFSKLISADTKYGCK